jgi:tRNA pseudouridine38-40 synthase
MQGAADVFVGTHDFRAACGPLEPGRTSVRSVSRAGWCRRGDILQFDIEADAFLPQMVRRLTGALVGAGRGSITKEELAVLLEQAKRGTIGPTAPGHGLCLQHVTYDEGYLP